MVIRKKKENLTKKRIRLKSTLTEKKKIMLIDKGRRASLFWSGFKVGL